MDSTAKVPRVVSGVAGGSEVHLDEWVSPDVCDERGVLQAGKILEWMDVVGVLAATRHCRQPVVTASADGMELRDEIGVGAHVAMTASVAHTSERSVGVSVAMSHSRAGQASRRTVSGFMTFVALDEQGRALQMPQFRPETPAEIARFREGSLRREFREQLRRGALPPAAARTLPPEATLEERRLLVGEWLKVLPRRLRMPWERQESPRARGRQRSYVHKIEPIRATNLNFHGTLYGGTLMRWIETNAYLSARAYLDGAQVRFTGLHGLTFIRPVRRHVFVHVRSLVAHAAVDSLTVLVTVEAEDPVGGTYEETLRAFLMYAPVEAAHIRVPPLDTVSREEKALFQEVEQRLALQRSLAFAPKSG